MKWLLCMLAACALAPQGAWGSPSWASPARFAIVVGNNLPERAGAEPLRYADDDAVALHRLLLEAKVTSILLTNLDSDTQRLAGHIRPTAPPRRDALESAFAAQVKAMREVNQRGGRTELLLYLSGHGDVDDGEGYAVLEDGRLSRSALYALLARSPAARNHVFIDSCKSYFLAFDRAAGGERTTYGRHFALPSSPAQLPNTGFVLSTSSARDSHEWERYQGGILSHEVRSALRGAADLNRDGAVTYAELGAFLGRANRDIDNPRFRPEFKVRAPGNRLDEVVLDWPAGADVVELAPSGMGHIYVESERGDRVLDAHPQPAQALTLHLPPARPLFIRKNDDKAELVVGESGSVKVASLQPATPQIRTRGALDVAFERLFASPFGSSDLTEFARQAHTDAALLAQSHPRSTSRAKTVLAIASVVTAVAAMTFGALAAREYVVLRDAPQDQIESRNRTLVTLRTASLVCLGLAGASAIAWTSVPARPTETMSSAGMVTPAVLGISGRF